MDLWCRDGIAWQTLPSVLVAAGEEQELARFKKMGMCSYVLREDAENDAYGVHEQRHGRKTASQVQIGQAIAFGGRLVAGTPMSAVLLLLHSKEM